MQIFSGNDNSGAQQLGTAAAVVSALLVLVFIIVWARRDESPALASGGAVLVFLLAAAYVLPWYAAWGLPVFALVWRSRLARLTALHAAILVVAYA
jgi:hypothetical protein